MNERVPLFYFNYDDNEWHKKEVNAVLSAYVDLPNSLIRDTAKRCYFLLGDERVKEYILTNLKVFIDDGWIKIREF